MLWKTDLLQPSFGAVRHLASFLFCVGSGFDLTCFQETSGTTQTRELRRSLQSHRIDSDRGNIFQSTYIDVGVLGLLLETFF